VGKGAVKDVTLSCYIKNVLDETDYSSRGYPSTDRTFGAALSFSM
jgi:hypothetical protein